MALTPEEQLELNDLLRDQEEINARLIEQNRALATASGSERRELESRIASERTRLALTEERRGELERIVEVERQATEEQERQAQLEQERQDSLEESHRYIDEMGQSMARMTKEGKEWLTKSNNGYTQMGSLIATIGELKQQQAGLDGDALARNIEQIGIFEQLGEQMRQSAEQVGEQERMFKGINADQLERVEFERSIAKLTEEQKIQARELYEINKKLLETEERYKILNEAKADLMSSLPQPLQDAVSFGKKLIGVIKGVGLAGGLMAAGALILIAALISAVKQFTELDSAAKEFRETTGLTNSQMKGMNKEVNNIVGKYAKFGVTAKDVYETQAALVEQFADFVDYSEAAVAGLTAMKQNLGVSSKTAAEVQGIFENVGGLSQDTAVSVQMQVANMAKLAKVAPRKVMEDIAESAEEASTFFHGDINALAKAAVEARRLGSSIKEVNKVAETLLDFEGGIEKELKAATFVQGQFNLSTARGLAAQGLTVQANQEILRQLERTGKFKDKDYWTQKALADAAGMTVEQINKQLNVQDKLSKLSKEQQDAANAAMEKGLDLSNVSEDQLNTEVEKFAIQQEQASQVEKLSNAFNGIVATLGNSLTPLLEGLIPIVNLILLPIQAAAEGFKIMIDFLKEHIILAGILGTALTVIFARQIGLAVASIWSGIVGMLGPFGIPVAIAATIGAVSMIKSAMTVGDMASPADGKTQVSTKEGGLFELSPNDDIVAAPGLLSGGGMKSSAQSVQGDINVVFPKEGVNSIISGIKSNLNGGTNTSNATETNLQTVQTNTPTNSVQTQTNELATTTQSNITTNTNTTTPSGLSGLSVPLNAMIEELKALRADMASGKIGVFMDGSKVTAGIAKQVDKNTRNHYSMA
jgi:endonuclease III